MICKWTTAIFGLVTTVWLITFLWVARSWMPELIDGWPGSPGSWEWFRTGAPALASVLLTAVYVEHGLIPLINALLGMGKCGKRDRIEWDCDGE